MSSQPAEQSTDDLPVIDFTNWLSDPSAEAEIARQIDDAFCTYGFAYFSNIPVDPTLRERLFEMSRAFHELPMEEKLKLSLNKSHRGYMPPDSETVKTSSVDEVKHPNFSESFMFMHEMDPSHPRWGRFVNGPNQWPEEELVPGFREAVLEYQAAMQEFCFRLLRTFELALNLPANYFDPYFEVPTTFLRLLHYPPKPALAHKDATGIAPHTDFGFLTMLAQDNYGGLEVRRKGGGWIPAPPVENAYVVNVADVLARWTNRRWVSTPHRVLHNTSDGHRFSCPYFFDTDLEVPVHCMPSCTDADTPPRYEPITYGEILEKHLSSNYSYSDANAG